MYLPKSLDKAAVDSYISQLCTSILDDFFKVPSQKASGKDLLEITPVKQVNMFLIRSLYDKWKEDMAKLKSPYFDFENNEVQNQLRDFMNVLSQHISVGRVPLQALLTEALEQTILFASDTLTFFRLEVEKVARPIVQMAHIESLKKYIVVNKMVLDAVIEEVSSRRMTEIYAGEIIRYFHQAINDRSHQLFELKEFVELMNPIVPSSVDKLCGKKERDSIIASLPQSKSFFDTIDTTDKPAITEVKPVAEYKAAEPEIIPEAKAVSGLDIALARLKEIEEQNAAKEIELQKAEAAIAEVLQPSEVQDIFDEESAHQADEIVIAEEEIIIQPVAESLETPKAAPTPALTPIEILSNLAKERKNIPDSEITTIGNTASVSLNEQLADSMPKSLAEKLSSDNIPTFAEIPVKNAETSIQSMIGFNDRFKFVSELFKNDNLAWTEATELIDHAGSRNAAMELVLGKLAYKWGWDISKPVVQKFIEVIEKKYK